MKSNDHIPGRSFEVIRHLSTGNSVYGDICQFDVLCDRRTCCHSKLPFVEFTFSQRTLDS